MNTDKDAMLMIKKLLNSLLIALVILSTAPTPTHAQIECAIMFITGIPSCPPSANIGADLKIKFGIADVEELKQMIESTEAAGERLLKSLSGEYEKALQATLGELRTSLSTVDGILASRIAQIDQVLNTKLIMIQRFVNNAAKLINELITTISTEASKLISSATADVSQLLSSALAEARLSVEVLGTQLRLSIDQVEQLATQLSAEIQTNIQQLIAGLQELLEQFEKALEDFADKVRNNSLIVLDNALYTVERTFELVLSVTGVLLALIFLFLASMRWANLLYRRPLPPSGLQRTMIVSLLAASYLFALLPFIVLYRPVRIMALSSAGLASPYNPEFEMGDIGKRFLVLTIDKPPDKITRDNPELRISGEYLLKYGIPIARYGDHDLGAPVVMNDTLLVFDTAVVRRYPGHANQIDLWPSVLAQKPILSVRLVAPTEDSASPQSLATVIPTATPVPDIGPTLKITRGPARVRRGPGEYETIDLFERGTIFPVTGKAEKGPWWRVILPNNDVGWISAGLVNVEQFDRIPIVPDEEARYISLPTPTPLPTPTACVEPSTSHFSAASSTIRLGEETILTWGHVQNAESVGIEGGDVPKGVDFAGELKVSPQRTTTYKLTALFCSGQKRIVGEVTVEVTFTQTRGICDRVQGHLGYGQQTSGQVQSADCWPFDGTAGQWVEVTMSSSDMDTFLELYAPDGTLLLSNDDDGDTRHSRIYVDSLPETGRYLIVAKGYSGARGSYLLTLR